MPSKKAFTLVELIVVITILAVLGTVAFVSFQDYVGNSRDSKRTTDIKNIEKALELSKLQTGVYPNPGTSTNITYSGATAWKQGEFNNEVVRVVRNFKEAPKDPLVDSFYAYSVTKNRGEYQLGGVLEDIDYGTSANGKLAGAYVKGNYNGKTVKVSTGSTTYVLAAPSILTSDLNETDLLKITQAQKLVYKNHKNLPASYTGTTYDVNGGFDFIPKSGTIVAYEGDLATVDNSTLVDNLQAIFTGSVIADESDIEVIFSKNKDLIADVVLGKKPSTSYSSSSSSSSSSGGFPEAITGWRLLDPNCKINDIIIGSQTWAGCNSTLGAGLEWGKKDDGSNGTIGPCFDYNGTRNTSDPDCSIGNPNMDSNTSAKNYFELKQGVGGTSNHGDSEFDTIWGKLYTWSNTASACPTGRSLPTDDNWTDLETTLNGSVCRAGNSWDCDGLGWKFHNGKTNTNNLANALKIPLTGSRSAYGSIFDGRGSGTWLWSDTANSTVLNWNYSTVFRATTNKRSGLSVRCIKD